jgi:hypothetical protein
MRRLFTLMLFMSFAACAPSRGTGPDVEADQIKPPAMTYQGPRIEGSMADAQLSLAVGVRSGGFDLVLLRTADGDGYTRVDVELIAPADGQVVTMAEEIKKLRVAVVDTSKPVWVYVRQIQRGAHYFVPPELALAAVVER